MSVDGQPPVGEPGATGRPIRERRVDAQPIIALRHRPIADPVDAAREVGDETAARSELDGERGFRSPGPPVVRRERHARPGASAPEEAGQIGRFRPRLDLERWSLAKDVKYE